MVKASPAPNGVDRDPTITEYAQMERDGYLVVRNFFGTNQIADLLRWTTEFETPPVQGQDQLQDAGRGRLIQPSRSALSCR
jgi:hypothetical protein